jgi:ribosomal protein S27AE
MFGCRKKEKKAKESVTITEEEPLKEIKHNGNIYTVKKKCQNCSEIVFIHIPKGNKINHFMSGHVKKNGICPYCGCFVIEFIHTSTIC